MVASHGTSEYMAGEQTSDGVSGAYRQGGVAVADRDSRQFADFVFVGLELVPPGVVVTPEWRPEPGPVHPTAGEASTNAGVARKP